MKSDRPELLKFIPQPLERLAVYFTLPGNDEIQGAKPNATLTSLLGRLEHPYDPVSSRTFLGALPTYTIPSTATMVVSISTYEELACFNVPDDKLHVFLHIPDRTAIVPTDDALDVVLQMRQFLQDNPDGNILIHCKQGHSRSMMMLAALFTVAPVIHDLPSDLTLQEACDFIKSKRSWTHVESDKFNKAKDIVDQFNSLEKTECHMSEEYQTDEEYVSSLDGKDDIRRMREFIQFVAYVTRIKPQLSSIATSVQEFLDEILFSEDGKWYQSLKERSHFLQKELQQGSEFERRFNALLDGIQCLCLVHTKLVTCNVFQHLG